MAKNEDYLSRIIEGSPRFKTETHTMSGFPGSLVLLPFDLRRGQVHHTVFFISVPLLIVCYEVCCFYQVAYALADIFDVSWCSEISWCFKFGILG